MRTLIAASVAAALIATSALAAPSIDTREISATGPGGELKGTWRGPSGEQAPIVLFVPGSGPTSRDGDNPLGVAGGPYRKLMEALAAADIATVAVDKRGQFGSAGATFGDAGPTIAAYAADMKAWIAQIREETAVPCVWLAGHSEGGLVTLVTAQDAEGVCGVILVAAPGRRLSDAIRQQISSNPANPPEILTQTEQALKELEAGRTLDTSGFHPALAPLFNTRVQPFLISMFSYDPADLVRSYPGPVLVVQGTTDLQITMEDANRLAGARPGVKLVTIEGMNHVLRQSPADRNANMASYGDANAALSPGVAEAIAAFVKAPR